MLAAAWLLWHGVMPWRDFVFVHPPAVPVLLCTRLRRLGLALGVALLGGLYVYGHLTSARTAAMRTSSMRWSRNVQVS